MRRESWSQVRHRQWAAVAFATFFFLTAFTVAVSAQEVTLACSFEQTDGLVGAPLLLTLTISQKANAGVQTAFPLHMFPGQAGPDSCFKVRCTGPDGKELPMLVKEPNAQFAAHVRRERITGTGSFRATFNIEPWFKPPAGGPYKIEAAYEWTQDVQKLAPHWKGKTNVAKTAVSLHAMDYGALDAAARERLNKALEEIPRYQRVKEHEQTLTAMGAAALPALHDALQIGNLDLRRSILRVLGAIHSPASVQPLIHCGLNLGGENMVDVSLLEARDAALLAYGDAILPQLKKAATRENALESAIAKISNRAASGASDKP